jgi:hypothetical protein
MDASDLPGTRFAVVHDIAASWDHYRLVRLEVDGAEVEGLILHAAGRTDEGFRTIDVWDTEVAWLRYRVRLDNAFDDLAMPPVVREFRVSHLVSPEFPSRNLRADRTKRGA